VCLVLVPHGLGECRGLGGGSGSCLTMPLVPQDGFSLEPPSAVADSAFPPSLASPRGCIENIDSPRATPTPTPATNILVLDDSGNGRGSDGLNLGDSANGEEVEIASPTRMVLPKPGPGLGQGLRQMAIEAQASNTGGSGSGNGSGGSRSGSVGRTSDDSLARTVFLTQAPSTIRAVSHEHSVSALMVTDPALGHLSCRRVSVAFAEAGGPTPTHVRLCRSCLWFWRGWGWGSGRSAPIGWRRP
jgi:hypothetical protein